MDDKRNKLDSKYDLPNLNLDEYDYSEWYKKWDDEKELDNLPPLEGDEEKYNSAPSTPLSKGDKKEGKGLKVFTPKKLFTRLPILLEQIQTGNNSSKLKNEIRQIVHLLYQYNTITKKFYNNLIKTFNNGITRLWQQACKSNRAKNYSF